MKFCPNLRPAWWLLIAIIAFLAACAAPMQAPRSTADSIYYSYASLAAMRETTAQMVDRKEIDAHKAQQLQARFDVVRKDLDMARAYANAGAPQNAVEYLSAARDILIAIESELKAKELK